MNIYGQSDGALLHGLQVPQRQKNSSQQSGRFILNLQVTTFLIPLKQKSDTQALNHKNLACFSSDFQFIECGMFCMVLSELSVTRVHLPTDSDSGSIKESLNITRTDVDETVQHVQQDL